MSRIADPSRSAIADPLAYPGEIPDRDFLLVGDRYVGLTVSPERELAAAGVDDRHVGAPASLGDVLESLAVAPLEDRTVLVAIGSNASPHQLRRKLAGVAGVDSVVPAVRAVLEGADVVYSAHVTRYGAVPATLHESPGTRVSVHALYVDAAQLAHIAATESANYNIHDVGDRLTVDSADAVEAGSVFVSRHGALLVDGSPIRLGVVGCENATFPERVHGALVGELNEALLSVVGLQGRAILPDQIVSGELSAEAATTRLKQLYGNAAPMPLEPTSPQSRAGSP